MKKQIIFLILAVIAVHGLYGMTQQQVLQVVVSSHTRALDRKNMYERPLEREDVNKWHEAIKAVEDFAAKNSKKHKKAIMKNLNVIKNANNNLINGIKAAYGEVVGGEFLGDVHKQFSPMFTVIDTNMKDVQQALLWMPSKVDTENEAIKMVGILAKFVSATARKADSNLNPARNNG